MEDQTVHIHFKGGQFMNKDTLLNKAIFDINSHFYRIINLVNLKLEDSKNQSPLFPADRPFTVTTKKGSCRIEAIAFGCFKYCCYRYEVDHIDCIPFCDIGEAIYNEPCTPRTTIQNLINRAEAVNPLGIRYYYEGEWVRIQY